MTAAILQLVARGKQDAHLTGNPEITYFKFVYKKHTNFSIENKQLDIINGPSKLSIGKGEKDATTFEVVIDKFGDLVHLVYINMYIPEIKQDYNSNDNQVIRPQFYNSIGHLLINEVSIEIGGQEIDKHYGEWMEIWSQLTYSEAKQLGFQYMVGRVNSNNTHFYSDKPFGGVMLQIPLHFWFCRHIGSALPLVALQFHTVKLKIKLNPINDVINKGNTCLTGYFLNHFPGDFTGTHFYSEQGVPTPGANTDLYLSNRTIATTNGPALCFDPSRILVGGVSATDNLANKKPKTIENNLDGATENASSFDVDSIASSQQKQHDCSYINPQDDIGIMRTYAPNSVEVNAPDFGVFQGNANKLVTVEARPNSSTQTIIDKTIKDYLTIFSNNSTLEVTADYIYLDTVERKSLGAKEHVYLIEQVQQVTKDFNTNNNNITLTDTNEDIDGGNFKFDISVLNHPVKSLYWFVKPAEHKDCYYKFNFSNKPVNNFIAQKDPIKECKITMNSIDRTRSHKGEYFRYAQPFQHHTRNSNLFVYMYSFCLNPEDLQPSGTCNFSRIDTAHIEGTFNNIFYDNVRLTCYALNYNQLRISKGMGGLLYSN